MKTAVEYANRRTGLNAPLSGGGHPAGVQADTDAWKVSSLTRDYRDVHIAETGLLLPGALYRGHVLTANVGVPVELVANCRRRSAS